MQQSHLLIWTAIVPHHKEASHIEGGMSTWVHTAPWFKWAPLHTWKRSLSKQKLNHSIIINNHSKSTLLKSFKHHPIIRPVILVQLSVPQAINLSQSLSNLSPGPTRNPMHPFTCRRLGAHAPNAWRCPVHETWPLKWWQHYPQSRQCPIVPASCRLLVFESFLFLFSGNLKESL